MENLAFLYYYSSIFLFQWIKHDLIVFFLHVPPPFHPDPADWSHVLQGDHQHWSCSLPHPEPALVPHTQLVLPAVCELFCLWTEPQGLLWHSPQERIGKSIIMSSRTLLQCFLTGKDIFRIVMWLKDLVNQFLWTMWDNVETTFVYGQRASKTTLAYSSEENW